MTSHRIARRHFTICACATLARPASAQEPPGTKSPFPKDAAEAINRLKDGNVRFAAGKTRHAHESADWRKQLVGNQKPFATILGCSDSRVPIELVFDQGFGDLFVVRVAGNVVAPDIVGSLAYAVAHLATPLVVVLGHERCGAVTAALQAIQGPIDEPTGVKTLVDLIKPGLPETLPGQTVEQQINAAVEANVRWSMKQLAQLPEAKKAMAAKRVTLFGAIYELTSGRVRFLAQ